MIQSGVNLRGLLRSRRDFACTLQEVGCYGGGWLDLPQDLPKTSYRVVTRWRRAKLKEEVSFMRPVP